jgi:transcriptional regulator with XRE-family HTH domain
VGVKFPRATRLLEETGLLNSISLMQITASFGSLPERKQTMNILERIKEVRIKKRITLKEMSKRTGISMNYLSQIERGKSNPSIGIIKKITDALDVPIWGLEELDSSGTKIHKVEIVRSDMRKMLIFPKSKRKSYLLTPDLQRKMEVLLSEDDPEKEVEEEWYEHEGEEFGFVLAGRYEVMVEDQVYILEEGDSIYFPSRLPHKMRGIGEKVCRVMWVITPPSF